MSLIFEINHASFKWYLVLGGTLVLLDLFTNGLLGQVGISRNAVVGFIVLSAALEFYYNYSGQLNKTGLANYYLNVRAIRLRDLILYGAGALLLFWSFFSYEATKQLQSDLIGGGINRMAASVLIAVFYLFILLNISHKETTTEISLPEKEEFSLPLLPVTSVIGRYLDEQEKETVARMEKQGQIFILPGCLNFCSLVVIGGDNPGKFSWWSFFAWFIGAVKVLINLGGEQVNDFWYYPWMARRQLKKAGHKIINFEASSLALPYFKSLLPLSRWLDKFRGRAFFRNFGYKIIVVVQK